LNRAETPHFSAIVPEQIKDKPPKTCCEEIGEADACSAILIDIGPKAGCGYGDAWICDEVDGDLERDVPLGLFRM